MAPASTYLSITLVPIELVMENPGQNYVMSGKHKDRDPARSTKSTGSRKPARYWCVACDRPRSPTYHLRHPSDKPPPPQGVCRRCIKEEQSKEHPPPPPAIVIYEVHHYYHHACACTNEQPFASPPVELPQYPAYPQCAELPAEEKNSLSLHQLFEPAPPPVKFGVKPSYWKR